MICRYCSANNNDHDHRCGKCGRRLYLAVARPEVIPSASRAATARVMVAEQAEQPVAYAEASPDGMPRQGVLFNEARPEGLHLVRTPEALQQRREVLARLGPVAPPARPVARAANGQQRIPFGQSARPDEPVSDSGIYCEAPVAVPVHRALAGAIDSSMVLLAVALFGGIVSMTEARAVLEHVTLPIYLAAIGFTMALYQIMWALAGMDSVGIRWAGLRTVTFEGAMPDRERRLWRLIAFGISALPLCMGLLWSLVDEEHLAWHDHMSKTFPTLRRTPAGAGVRK